jgi:hypothetical protein
MKLAVSVRLGFLETPLFILECPLTETGLYSRYIPRELFKRYLIHFRDDLKGLVEA